MTMRNNNDITIVFDQSVLRKQSTKQPPNDRLFNKYNPEFILLIHQMDDFDSQLLIVFYQPQQCLFKVITAKKIPIPPQIYSMKNYYFYRQHPLGVYLTYQFNNPKSSPYKSMFHHCCHISYCQLLWDHNFHISGTKDS